MVGKSGIRVASMLTGNWGLGSLLLTTMVARRVGRCTLGGGGGSTLGGGGDACLDTGASFRAKVG